MHVGIGYSGLSWHRSEGISSFQLPISPMIPSGILCSLYCANISYRQSVSQLEDIDVTVPSESKKCVFSGLELQYAAL